MTLIKSYLVAAILITFGSSALALPPANPPPGSNGASCVQVYELKCTQTGGTGMGCATAAKKFCQIIYPQVPICTANCASTPWDFELQKYADYMWYYACEADLGVITGGLASGLATIVGSIELAKTLIGAASKFASPCGYVGTQIFAQLYAEYYLPNPPTLP